MEALLAAPSIDGEIEKAVAYLKSRQFEVAFELLKGLAARPGLTNAQKFQLFKLQGHAYLNGPSDQVKSARCYLDAKACQPDSEQGLGLEALAELLLSHREHAAGLAAALLARHPRAVLGIVVRVRTAPDDAAFTDLEAMVPEDLRGDADIASALADRAWASAPTVTTTRCRCPRRRLGRGAGGLYVEAMSRSDQGGILTKVQGQHVLIPNDKTRIEARRSDLKDLIEWVNKVAVVDGLGWLRLGQCCKDRRDDALSHVAISPIGRTSAEIVAKLEYLSYRLIPRRQRGATSPGKTRRPARRRSLTDGMEICSRPWVATPP